MDQAPGLPSILLGILEEVLPPFVPDLLAFTGKVAEQRIWMGLPLEWVLRESLHPRLPSRVTEPESISEKLVQLPVLLMFIL